MIDNRLSPAELRAGELRLRTAGGCDLSPEHLIDVFTEQRRGSVEILQGFGPDDWAAPTRCADWSAHDVIRHLCDGSAFGASAGPDDGTLDMTAGFDPRTTPGLRMTESAGEPPGVTLSRFVTTTEQLFADWRTRLTEGRRFDVQLPYGPMDWTVLILHGFWDSWLHERDVLLARRIHHPTGNDATGYAAAYGVFIAAAVASMFGDPVQQKLTLGGNGGGVFDLANRDGAVTLTVSRLTVTGPSAADVTDALAGRASTATVLGHLPTAALTALSHMADFFRTPVNQSNS